MSKPKQLIEKRRPLNLKCLLALAASVAVTNATWASDFEYTAEVDGSHMRLTPTGAGEICWHNRVVGSRPVANCAAGEYRVDIWHGGNNGWKSHVWKATNTSTVTLGDDPGGSYEHTSEVPGTHMRLRLVGTTTDCWANDTNGSKPVARCAAGEYNVDVWHGPVTGWENHVWKSINTNPVTLGGGTVANNNTTTSITTAPEQIPASGTSTANYQAKLKGQNMRLVPTANNSHNEQCNNYGATEPAYLEVNCPIGEYILDLWTDGWSKHVIKGEVINVGNDITTASSEFSDNSIARNSNGDFNHRASEALGNLPYFADDVNLSDGEGNDPHFVDVSETNSVNPDTNANFRVGCQWSHFNYDDSIVALNEPNKAHLHMYFGNTYANNKTSSDPGSGNYITKRGGGSCNGFGINRSAYWIPALMKENSHAVVPKEIIVYYKSRAVCTEISNQAAYCGEHRETESGGNSKLQHHPRDTVKMPQGLQLISGNDRTEENTLNVRYVERGLKKLNDSDTNTISEHTFWSCGRNGAITKKFNRIPTSAEWNQYCSGQARDWQNKEVGHNYLNATVSFPQCRKAIDPNNANDPNLKGTKAGGYRDHVRMVTVDQKCPVDFPERMPQLSFLIYWDITELGNNTDQLRLSSDPTEFGESALHKSDLNSNGNKVTYNFAYVNDQNGTRKKDDQGRDIRHVRGGTLHGDWIAGWHEETMNAWLEGCVRSGNNCTFGQTGKDDNRDGKNARLAALNGDYGFYYHGHPRNDEKFVGSFLIKVPGGMHHSHQH